MKNSRLKNWIIVCVGGLLLVIISYSIYTTIFGVKSEIIIHNNSRSVFFNQDKYEYVDFRIIVNDKEIFNESLSDSLHTEMKLDVDLSFGHNRIEVYSDSSKQYDIKSEYIFLKKDYLVSFTRAIDGIDSGDEYYRLAIDSR